MNVYLAVDVYYGPSWVRGACVGFVRADDELPAFTHVEHVAGAAGDYESGEFKKRELPYLETLVAAAREKLVDAGQTRDALAAILVDGYVWLDGGRPGLGGHLFAALGERIPIIGIAKTRYRGAAAIEVLRGQSKAPLLVTAAGLDPDVAAVLVRSLHGEYRIPTMLRLVDRASRSEST